MGSRIPSSLNDNFAMVSINWKLDLSVQEGELAYRVVTRLKGEEAAIFTLENNVRIKCTNIEHVELYSSPCALIPHQTKQ